MEKDLFQTLTSNTDLPSELLEKELTALLESAKLSPQDLDLETLRKLMVGYLQDVFVEAKKEFVEEAAL